jgi:hypothetical protein
VDECKPLHGGAGAEVRDDVRVGSLGREGAAHGAVGRRLPGPPRTPPIPRALPRTCTRDLPRRSLIILLDTRAARPSRGTPPPLKASPPKTLFLANVTLFSSLTHSTQHHFINTTRVTSPMRKLHVTPVPQRIRRCPSATCDPPPARSRSFSLNTSHRPSPIPTRECISTGGAGQDGGDGYVHSFATRRRFQKTQAGRARARASPEHIFQLAVQAVCS